MYWIKFNEIQPTFEIFALFDHRCLFLHCFFFPSVSAAFSLTVLLVFMDTATVIGSVSESAAVSFTVSW